MKRSKRMSVTKEPSDERVYVLICDNDGDLKGWVDDINRNVLRLGLSGRFVSCSPSVTTPNPETHFVCVCACAFVLMNSNPPDPVSIKNPVFVIVLIFFLKQMILVNTCI